MKLFSILQSLTPKYKKYLKYCKNNDIVKLENHCTKYKFTKKDALFNNGYGLVIATTKGHIDIVKMITNKFNINKDDIYYHDYLIIRLTGVHGHLNILKFFVKKYYLTNNDLIKEKNSTFQNAVIHGYLDIVKYIISLCDYKYYIRELALAYQNANICKKNDIKEYIHSLIFNPEASPSMQYYFIGLTK